ncbi:MAG TPA: hypothetical protein VIG57_17395 [Candidatus Entotheonella sp.]|jgi:hypothetical protein
MGTGGVILTFAIILVAASAILALVFRLWPRYGSVEAAIEESDHELEKLETAASH